MPSSYGRALVAAAVFFVLTFSPLAHAAQTAIVPIGDPETDTLQLWSEIATSIEFIAQDAASAAGHLTSAVQHLASAMTAPHPQQSGSRPHTPKQLPSALAQSASVGAAALAETATAAANEQSNSIAPQQPQSRSPPNATSHQTTTSINVKSPAINPAELNPATPAFNASAFVTQDQFNAGMSALGASLLQLIAESNSDPIISGSGAPLAVEEFAPSQEIDTLDNVTITNATVNGVSGLTASDIPTDIVAANYLPLTGGTLTGNLSLSGALTAGSLSVAGISSSGALIGPYFSATSTTATSTFAGGFSISGYSALATTTITGGLTVNGNTNITQGGELTVGDKVIAPGEIGLGTSSPYAKLSVQSTIANQTVLALVGTTSQSSPFIDIFSIAGANLFRITAGGNVGIGQANPTYPLDVSGPGHFSSFVDAANFVATSSSATSLFNGNLTVNGNTTLANATSTNLTVTGTASTTNLIATYGTTTSLFVKSAFSSPNATIGALTATNTLGVYNSASFGATATSSFDSAGDLTVAGNTTLGAATSASLVVSNTASTSNLVASTGFTFEIRDQRDHSRLQGHGA